ncbi:hypothetical protein [Cellulomonas fengjieae]|uniref:hypothetical protein n=1 Tax=Cellulomonas fengjieae TaxID=2819978 RepID=UPI001AAEB5C2|nr:hypothetical protein [Cellulomonas fengjieae]MBO3102574.1 hypothetical protein [Cellulomonas fengjieae]
MQNPLAWRPPVNLPDAQIRIADVAEPLSTHDSWRATLGGHLYLLAGTGTEPSSRDRVTGYAGISAAPTSGRPWASLTHWVRNAAALDIDTIALVTLRSEPDPDALRVIECAVIRHLNRTTYMLNTVTAAPTPSRVLGDSADTYAAFGQLLAIVLRHHALRGRANPLLSPASTLRETAIRVVLASNSALDTTQVINRITALGGPAYTGNSIGATVRRDLTQREAGLNAGQPRVLSTHLKGRCLYYPNHVPRRTAVARYLDAASGHAAA